MFYSTKNFSNFNHESGVHYVSCLNFRVFKDFRAISFFKSIFGQNYFLAPEEKSGCYNFDRHERVRVFICGIEASNRNDFFPLEVNLMESVPRYVSSSS